jgi:predicted transcriptional regulator
MSHPNSAASLKKTDKAERYRLIISALEREQKPMTDREIARYLGFSDMNAVRPRITELVQAGTIRDAGNKRDETTGRTVRTVALVNGRLF